MFHWFPNTSPIMVSEFVSEYTCFYYYYFHFELIKLISSRSQMSIKIDVFKILTIFTEKLV